MKILAISDWIDLAGVFVTGLFSFLVWRATLKTVEVSKAMFELNQRVTLIEEKREKEYRNNMRMQWIYSILADSEIVYNSLARESPIKLHRAMLKIKDVDLKINMNDLAAFFDDSEVKLINSTWDFYRKYKSDYFKEVYPGNEIDILFEKAPRVSEKFYLLIEWLKTAE